MIVEPDFLTHWKTRTLVRVLDYDAAPLCVLALWAHCQQRKTDRFHGMTPEVFAAVCDYPFPPGARDFYDAMLAAGFVELDGDTLIVHDFAKANSQLFANWQNGARGGRPSKTQREPIHNPSETHRKPIPEMGKPIDKIREEKIGEDKIRVLALKRQAAPAEAVEVPDVLRNPLFGSLWETWLRERPKARKPTTQKFQLKFLATLGLDGAVASIEQSLQNGWTGLFEPRLNGNGNHAPVKKPSGASLRQEQLDRIPVVTP